MGNNRIEIACDMNQGFNFRKDVMTQIGMINRLKIGDVELAADITLKDPENNQTDKKVVGVLNYIGWGAAPTEQVTVAVQVTETAKNKLDGLTKKNMSNIEVDLDFDCYTYDPREKKYFKNFHSNDVDMKGLIFGEGDDLAIRIHLDQNQMVQAPRNYTLELGVKPQPTAQDLHYASSVNDKLVLQWGVTES
ncbi:MAG: hypothetical protein VX589_11885 [Myxococcota bacterium]|nr:hypothetical protein [Myxococcota bacterium]